MKIFKGFLTCVSMFSVVPCKAFWEEQYLKWVIPTLNLLGLCVGVLWYLFTVFIVNTPLVPEFKALLILALPMFISGFIHIDGLLDTSDSLCSRQDLEKKREILKDSRIGAFGAIVLVMYIFFGYVIVLQMLQREITATIVIIPVVSRYMASNLLIKFNSFSKNGFADTFSKDIKLPQKLFMSLTLVVAIFIAYFFGDFKETLILALVLCITGFGIGEWICKHYKGVSGDLCGFVIAITELVGLFVYSVMGLLF